MQGIVLGLLIFAILLIAGLCSLALHPRFRDHYRSEDTHAVIRLAANLFVVLTSLVLGFMISSARSTFDNVDHNVHTISTGLILLDRALRQYGPDADTARNLLVAYVDHVLSSKNPDDPVLTDKTSEHLLEAAGVQITMLTPVDANHTALLTEAQNQYRRVVEMRWTLAEQSEGTIPTPLILIVVAGLGLIFASFGYRAPQNLVVVATIVLSAALVSCALYIVIDMEQPFDGPIQVSIVPVERALAEMRQ